MRAQRRQPAPANSDKLGQGAAGSPRQNASGRCATLYRRFGRTGLQVSILGVGGGYTCMLEDEAGRAIYRRALELGITYLDGRYGNSNTMLRPLVQTGRERLVLVTKTAESTAEGAMGRIEEDLAELGTDYLDVFYLRTYNQEMLEAHFAPGGSVEGVLRAKEQGKVRALGLAGHSDLTALARGIETDLVDACMFPLNIARREALEQLVPVALKHDVGMSIMKPMAVGMAPAHVSLPWLANTPMHVAVPGVSNVEQLELDVRLLDRPDLALAPEEQAEVAEWQAKLDPIACHICDRTCQPVCEAQIPIDLYLYHDIYYNEYRALGIEGLKQTPVAPWVRVHAEDYYAHMARTIRGCTHCGRCEAVCPYHLPIVSMLEKTARDCDAVAEALRAAGWKTQAGEVASPWSKPGRGGRRFMS